MHLEWSIWFISIYYLEKLYSSSMLFDKIKSFIHYPLSKVEEYEQKCLNKEVIPFVELFTVFHEQVAVIFGIQKSSDYCSSDFIQRIAID